MKDWGLYLRVRDRPGALERVLGMARRRAMHLRPDAVVRGSDGRWTVVFQVTSDTAALDRYVNEFRELHDLEQALPLRAGTDEESTEGPTP